MDTNGNLIWSLPFTNSGNFSTMVQGAGGNMYAAGALGVASVSTNGVVNWLAPVTNSGAANWLTPGPDGSIYGVCQNGGSNNAGQVVAISPGGSYLWTFSFGGTNYGSQPNEAVLVGSDGNLYGTTKGWIYSFNSYLAFGCLYSISPSGEWRWNFRCSEAYQSPNSLLNAPDGTLYLGTGVGVVDVSTNGVAEWNVSMQPAELGELVQSTDGILYVNGYSPERIETNGVVLQITSLSGISLQRRDGNLYGYSGTAVICLATNGRWATSQNITNAGVGALAQDEAGNLYGITSVGGVFELVTGPELLTWPTDVLPGKYGILSLTNNTVTYVGAPPLSMQWELNGVALTNGSGTNGTVLGAQTSHLIFNPPFTMSNGVISLILSNGFGVVTSPPAYFTRTNRFPAAVSGGVFSEPSPTNFPMKSQGGVPIENPIFISKGVSNSLYISTDIINIGDAFVACIGTNGATKWSVDVAGQGRVNLMQGVNADIYVNGGGREIAVYSPIGQLLANGGAVLNNFWGSIVQGPESNLYWTGEEVFGGALTASGDSVGVDWIYSTYTSAQRWSPTAMTLGVDENLYVTGVYFSSNEFGGVFSLATNGTERWVVSFDRTDGFYPESIISGSDGNLYGTTFGNQSDLLFFDGQPQFPMDFGELFCMSTNGEMRWIFHFNGSNGNTPVPELLEGADGYLYGTTYLGGTGNAGTVFRIAPSGTDFATVFNFSGGDDGANPRCGLVQLADGSFYGVASQGGINKFGTLFRLDLPAGLGAPALQSASITNGGLSLTWTTLPNRTYQVQFSDDLSSDTWTDLGPPILASAAFTSFNDTATANPQRFYRLVRL